MDFIFVIVFGGLWGSFANVCIYRFPNNEGVVSGRSFCPNCKTKINWYDNIPLISYIVLGGKCRSCKKKISIQYFIVETLSIILFTLIYYKFGASLTTLYLIILSLLILFFTNNISSDLKAKSKGSLKIDIEEKILNLLINFNKD